MGWCKWPLRFLSKPWCPMGDRLHPWTLLRFHYKLMSKWMWLAFITCGQIYFAEVSPPVATASSSAGGSQAAWHAVKEVTARISVPSFPFPGTTCSFHSTRPFTVYSTSHKPKPKFVPPATPLELQCPCPASITVGILPHSHTPARTHPATYPHCWGLLTFWGTRAMHATVAGNCTAPGNITG